jgi:hypothetical protein
MLLENQIQPINEARLSKEEYPLKFKIIDPKDSPVFMERYGDGKQLPEKLNAMVEVYFSPKIRAQVLSSLHSNGVRVIITADKSYIGNIGAKTVPPNLIILNMNTPLATIGDYLIHEVLHILTVNDIANFQSIMEQTAEIVLKGLKPGAKLKDFLLDSRGVGNVVIDKKEEILGYFGNGVMNFSKLKPEAVLKLKNLLFSGTVFNTKALKEVYAKMLTAIN